MDTIAARQERGRVMLGLVSRARRNMKCCDADPGPRF
jgi:hypothetical protein